MTYLVTVSMTPPRLGDVRVVVLSGIDLDDDSTWQSLDALHAALSQRRRCSWVSPEEAKWLRAAARTTATWAIEQYHHLYGDHMNDGQP